MVDGPATPPGKGLKTALNVIGFTWLHSPDIELKDMEFSSPMEVD